MRKRSIIAVETIILAFALAVTATAADPFTGTWQQDLSKTEGNSPTQLTLAPSDNGISIQDDAQTSIITPYGKDFRMKDVGTINIVRVDDHTLSSTVKMENGTIWNETATVSSDGKRYTRIRERTGIPGKITLVFDRVGSAPAGDTFFGTWREDPTKYKMEPLLTYILKVDGETFDWTLGARHAVTARFDGKEYKRDDISSTVQLKRLDDHTIEMVTKSSTGRESKGLWQVKGNALTLTLGLAGNQSGAAQSQSTMQFERIK
jgi:hypothetical protein